MNQEAQKIFDEILKLNPSELSRPQREFLRARSGYLKDSQVVEYKEVLESKEDNDKVSDEQPDALSEYRGLVKKAKDLGYKGPKMKRPQLEAYIAEHTNQ